MSLEKFAAILGILTFFLPMPSSGIYRFKLDVGNSDNLCPAVNYKCGENRTHFLCERPMSYEPKCLCHKQIKMAAEEKRALQRSTNGIRNKVAREFKIANMNVVYWSDDLSEMARIYLLQCMKYVDTCLIIGNKKLKVNQNSAATAGNITNRWPGRVVRSWYMELGPDMHEWNKFQHKIYSGNAIKLAHMINPLVEFMGCSGAIIEEEYVVICYYYPAFNTTNIKSDFIIGSHSCSKCDSARRVCSKTFPSLCGVDFDFKDSSRTANLCLNIFALIVFLLHVL